MTQGENGLSIANIFGIGQTSEIQQVIALDLRLPRMLCAIGVGALLAMSGCTMQTIFRNPLVEPYTMGISGGAVVGVGIAFMFGFVDEYGNIVLSIFSACGALCAMAIVLWLRRAVGADTQTTLICGIMISFVTSASTTLMLSLSTHENMTQVVAWTIGPFEGTMLPQAIFILAVATLLALTSPLAGKTLNILSLGDEEASAVGLNVQKTTRLLFILATLAASLSVATAGIVAFVGMAVPQVVNMIYGTDRRVSLPISALGGATLMVACDLTARIVIAPRELPAGAVCAAVGGLFFIYVVVRWRNQIN